MTTHFSTVVLSLVVCLTCLYQCPYAVAFIQIGSDIRINGEAAGDEFGHSVSMSADGSTLIVGAPSNDDNGSDSGSVRVFQRNPAGSNYIRFGSDIDGEATDDRFGYSVSISADGSTFVVGAPYNAGNGRYSGSVRVFKLNPAGSNYTQFGSDIDGEATDDQFGYSVSISGNGSTLIVGAPFSTNDNGFAAGSVRVFRLNPARSNYTQFGSNIDGVKSEDLFGFSVSISADGSTIIAGTRIYKFNPAGSNYTKFGSDIEGFTLFGQPGATVSLSGDGTTILVGDPNDGIDQSAGSVRVYKLNQAGSNYTQFGSDIKVEESRTRFGFSVSITGDGSTFIAGAPFSSMKSGSISVYKLNQAESMYTKLGSVVDDEVAAGDTTSGDLFGYSVSISADGSTMLVGEPQSDGRGVNSGSIHVFDTTKVRTKVPSSLPVRVPTIPIKAPTKRPTQAPSKLPTKVPTKRPTMAPTMAPTKVPTKPPTQCGLFRLGVFCPRFGKCSFLRRLFNQRGCQ